MTRSAFSQEVARRIGRRALVWFGLVGGNAQPLAHLPQFSAAFSVAAPAGLPGERDISLERLTGERVHTLGFKLRLDQSAAVQEFYGRLLAALSTPAVTVTHEASQFFASVYFLRQEFVQHLGLFYERQVVFDHKPWVESELRRTGLNVLPWRYFGVQADAALQKVLQDMLKRGPLVIRHNRSAGGQGLTLVREMQDVPPALPDAVPDEFIAVAPFFEPSVPLNVNACVFPDGSVSLHSPSLQLIGIPGYALSRFGYCGNDFAQVRELGGSVLRALQEMVLRTGRWLYSMGYLGAFGVDALLYQGNVYLTEVNPRFQGSSLLSSHLDAALDRPDVFLAHVGAFLGLPSPEPWDLETLAREQPQASHILARNGPDRRMRRNGTTPPPTAGIECWLLPDRGVVVHPKAILSRVIVRDTLTEDGWRLRSDVASRLPDLRGMLFDAVETERGSGAQGLDRAGRAART